MDRERLRQIIKEELSRAVNEGVGIREVPSWREIEKMPSKSNFKNFFRIAKGMRQNTDLVDQIAQHYDENYGGEEGFTGDDLRAAVAKYDSDMQASQRDIAARAAEERARRMRYSESEPTVGEETYEDVESAYRSLYHGTNSPTSFTLHKSPTSGRFFGRGSYSTSRT